MRQRWRLTRSERILFYPIFRNLISSRRPWTTSSTHRQFPRVRWESRSGNSRHRRGRSLSTKYHNKYSKNRTILRLMTHQSTNKGETLQVIVLHSRPILATSSILIGIKIWRISRQDSNPFLPKRNSIIFKSNNWLWSHKMNHHRFMIMGIIKRIWPTEVARRIWNYRPRRIRWNGLNRPKSNIYPHDFSLIFGKKIVRSLFQKSTPISTIPKCRRQSRQMRAKLNSGRLRFFKKHPAPNWAIKAIVQVTIISLATPKKTASVKSITKKPSD